jgi:hypothetical protein
MLLCCSVACLAYACTCMHSLGSSGSSPAGPADTAQQPLVCKIRLHGLPLITQIERSDKKVLNLLLGILDHGRCTSSQARHASWPSNRVLFIILRALLTHGAAHPATYSGLRPLTTSAAHACVHDLHQHLQNAILHSSVFCPLHLVRYEPAHLVDVACVQVCIMSGCDSRSTTLCIVQQEV